MAMQTYSRFAPETAVTNVNFSAVADGIVVTTSCTAVTLTPEGGGSISLGDTPAGTIIATRCEKVVFGAGTIKAFFLPA